MRIINYENPNAITVPVSLVQRTGQGDMVFVVQGNQAKAVQVTTGQTAGGQVEILSGLKAGDKLVVRGFEELDNGELVAIQ
jgi:membrane fusion protein (multidrug efflux system)